MELAEGRPLSRSREVTSFEILSPDPEGLRATKERAPHPLVLSNWVSVHRYTLGAHTLQFLYPIAKGPLLPSGTALVSPPCMPAPPHLTLSLFLLCSQGSGEPGACHLAERTRVWEMAQSSNCAEVGGQQDGRARCSGLGHRTAEGWSIIMSAFLCRVPQDSLATQVPWVPQDCL